MFRKKRHSEKLSKALFKAYQPKWKVHQKVEGEFEFLQSVNEVFCWRLLRPFA